MPVERRTKRVMRFAAFAFALALAACGDSGPAPQTDGGGAFDGGGTDGGPGVDGGGTDGGTGTDGGGSDGGTGTDGGGEDGGPTDGGADGGVGLAFSAARSLTRRDLIHLSWNMPDGAATYAIVH